MSKRIIKSIGLTFLGIISIIALLFLLCGVGPLLSWLIGSTNLQSYIAYPFEVWEKILGI